MIDIIQAKLARGGQMNAGELKLIMMELAKQVAQLEGEINELKAKLKDRPKRSSGASKSNPNSASV